MGQTALKSAVIVVGLLVIGLLPFGISKAQTRTLAVSTGSCNTPTTPFCDALMPPLAGWTGRVFKLSQDYPTDIPSDAEPWKQFDPTQQPLEYLRSVLAYFYDGNIRSDVEASFDPALNAKRRWYNAPWQDFGVNGREFVHGLTHERPSQPHELAPQQTSVWANYAVGFYNAPGGFVLGKVWKDHGKPDPSLAIMPDGTVAAKLLFTTVTVSEVPYLKGAPEWTAYVYVNPHDPNPKRDTPRAIQTLRLLQIDIAVRDSRADATTGWVFGTFVYGGGPGGKPGGGWDNVEPVGAMWGNDPGYPGSSPLQQTTLNPAVAMPHVGYQGRLNGPVDNSISSCLSCHSTAQIPPGIMTPPNGADPSRWFRNIPAGASFDPGRQGLDYSLQLEVGITNFNNKSALLHADTTQKREALMRHFLLIERTPPRAGGLLQ